MTESSRPAFQVQSYLAAPENGGQAPGQPLRRRSVSTPNNMSVLQQMAANQQDSKEGTKKKKKFNIKNLFRRGSRDSSQDGLENAGIAEVTANEALLRKTELDFAHTLMTKPAEMGLDFSGADSEPDLVQTICAPNCFSKQAIRLDKKLYQIDVANARVATLGSLSSAAVLASDQVALDFLQNTQDRIRRQQVTMFKEAEKLINGFIADPKRLLSENEIKQPAYNSLPGDSSKVQFIIDEPDSEAQDLRWEMNSLHFSTDATSSESDEEGPPPEEIQHLAKEIRKTEGTRFKRKIRIHRHHRNETESSSSVRPPPPNPLGFSKRALLRSHTTVPSGLCLQGHSNSSSSASLASVAQQAQQGQQGRGLKRNQSANTTLPFNLLSLTGQLSWLVSEYLERGSSTYQWATDLIHSISKMSVTRSTWLNVHQQLRETTELLYAHRSHYPNQNATTSASARGEVAWTNIQAAYQAIQMGDVNAATVTAETARQLLSSTNSKTDKQLTHFNKLLEKKFHLAYVCDLVLWRAHKLLFAYQDTPDADTGVQQLTDFRIRLLQVRLDQANVQYWSPELVDLLLRWIDEQIDGKSINRLEGQNRYCIDELRLLRKSIQRFQTLVRHITESEFTSEEYLQLANREDDAASVTSGSSENFGGAHNHSHHSLHCHPHHYHHGEGGHQQDLRPLDADRCSHTYAALIKQIHDHAMSQRPLSYFAVRALYDIAMELGCEIDWNNRLETLQTELTKAYEEWEQLFKVRMPPNYYAQIVGSNSKQA